MASAMPFNSSRYCDSSVHVHSTAWWNLDIILNGIAITSL